MLLRPYPPAVQYRVMWLQPQKGTFLSSLLMTLAFQVLKVYQYVHCDGATFLSQ